MLCNLKTIPKEEATEEELDGATSEMLKNLRNPIQSILGLFSPMKRDGIIRTIVTKFEDPAAPTAMEQRILGCCFAYPSLIANHLDGSKADTLRAVELVFGMSNYIKEEIETLRECASVEELKDTMHLELDNFVQKLNRMIEKVDDLDFKNLKTIIERLSLFNDMVNFYGGADLFKSEPEGEALSQLLN